MNISTNIAIIIIIIIMKKPTQYEVRAETSAVDTVSLCVSSKNSAGSRGRPFLSPSSISPRPLTF